MPCNMELASMPNKKIKFKCISRETGGTKKVTAFNKKID